MGNEQAKEEMKNNAIEKIKAAQEKNDLKKEPILLKTP